MVKKFSEQIVKNIPKIISDPKEIRLSKPGPKGEKRFLFAEYNGEPEVSIVEVASDKQKNTVVTAFPSNHNYLSEFALLWRTPTGISPAVPPSIIPEGKSPVGTRFSGLKEGQIQKGISQKSSLESTLPKAKEVVKGISAKDFYNQATKGIKEVKPEVPVKPPIEPPISTLAETPPTGDPVQKVIQALKEVKPIRGKQETLYSQERAKRLGKAMAVGKEVEGEAGFYAQLGQLKGELPKVEFESLRGKITQTDIDTLFNMVEQSPMVTGFEKIAAKEGLTKLFGELGGRVPTEGEIILLNRVFPKEFTEALLEKRPLFEKIKEAGLQLANIPRSLMSSFADLSFGFRQGITLIKLSIKKIINMNKQKEFYLVEELAEKLRVSNMTIYRYIKAKKIKAYKIGKEFRIDKEEFNKFLNKVKTNG